MNLILQPNKWSCAACAFAMCMDKTLEELIVRLGHDGSKPVVAGSPHKGEQHTGFHMSELILVSHLLGYHVTEIEALPMYGEGVPVVGWPNPADIVSMWPAGARFVLSVQSEAVCEKRTIWHCVAYECGTHQFHDPLHPTPRPWSELPPVGFIAAVRKHGT